MLVAISTRRHTLALLAAYPAVLHALIFYSCFGTPCRALAAAESFNNKAKMNPPLSKYITKKVIQKEKQTNKQITEKTMFSLT